MQIQCIIISLTVRLLTTMEEDCIKIEIIEFQTQWLEAIPGKGIASERRPSVIHPA